jgi:V/A-type H+-transporting ATPase subunit D
MLPMLADTSIDVKNLVSLSKVEISEENVVGVHVPVIKHLKVDVKDYSLFSKPHWVDQLVIQLKRMLTLKVEQQIKEQRGEALNFALRKITQRVNLFDKVLIPKAQQDIRKIRIYLSDMETAAVVRAKSTKQKRLKMSGGGL